MRKILNTLYVTTPDASLSRTDERVVVKKGGEKLLDAPICNFESIVTYGHACATPGLMQLCAERGVALSFMDRNGRFICRMQGGMVGHSGLRISQYEKFKDSTYALRLAIHTVCAKIHNTRFTLVKNGTDTDSEIAMRLKNYKRLALSADNIDALRAVEGNAAREYFGYLSNQPGPSKFGFASRSKYPPKDPVNCMLSYVFSILYSDCVSAIESVGLDPCIGYMHALRPGRASLACDLMEEFRAYMGDRVVLNLINRGQVSPTDFIICGNSVTMKDSVKKALIFAYQEKRFSEITHPYLGCKMQVGLLPHVQAQLLAKKIRGEVEEYVPFILK